MADGRVTGVRLEDGSTIDAAIVVSAVAPDLTVTKLIDPNVVPSEVRDRFARVDHRGSYLQMHFALDGMPTFAEPYEMLNDPEMQSAIGLFSTPEELQQQWEDSRRGIVPADPAIAMQFPSVHDPRPGPEGKHAMSAFSMWFPINYEHASYGDLKVEMGRRVIEKITRVAPDFESKIIRHTTFTPRHMGTMFGAPGGDYCHGLIHPEQMGPEPSRANGFHRPADSDRRPVPGQRRLPRRAGHHLHPRIQRRRRRRSPTRVSRRRARWGLRRPRRTSRTCPRRPWPGRSERLRRPLGRNRTWRCWDLEYSRRSGTRDSGPETVSGSVGPVLKYAHPVPRYPLLRARDGLLLRMILWRSEFGPVVVLLSR